MVRDPWGKEEIKTEMAVEEEEATMEAVHRITMMAAVEDPHTLEE
jgi:hypothetical protein